MKKLVIWILTGILAAAVLCGCAGQNAAATTQATEPPVPDAPKVYWNVDRAKYAEGAELTREKTGEYYLATFAVDGKQETVRFAKRSVLTYADTMDYMGFELDENGVVTKVLKIDEFTGGLAAYNLYVESITEELILCNTLKTFEGLTLKLYPNANSQYVLLDEADPTKTGTPITPQKGMQIIAIRDQQGFLLCAYLKPAKQ